MAAGSDFLYMPTAEAKNAREPAGFAPFQSQAESDYVLRARSAGHRRADSLRDALIALKVGRAEANRALSDHAETIFWREKHNIPNSADESELGRFKRDYLAQALEHKGLSKLLQKEE
jgi:hypothetical protein